jgi:glycosyltransferase involved in cell wall biosynthesis
MRSKKILMISSQFVPEVYGGAVSQCLKLSRQLALEGCGITILTSRNSFKLPAKEKMGNIDVVRIWAGKPPQLMGKYIWSSIFWFAGCIIWFIKHKNEFDLLHIHQAKFQAVTGALFGKWFNKPVIVKVGNSDAAFDLESLKRKSIGGNYLYNVVSGNTTKFIAISTQIEKNFANHNIKCSKIIKIPNGVYQPLPFEEIQQRKHQCRSRLFKDETGNASCYKYFLSAGRLSKEKNISLLIEAFADVAAQNENIKLIILGDGPLKEEIEALIQHKQIQDKVLLTGYVKNVNDYLIAADFFMLPSEVEGMSNSLLEAMSTGLIPIATNISGSADLIEHKKNGFLIDKPWNINLKKTIVDCAMLGDDWLRKMKCESYNTISRNYTMENIARQYMDLYNTLIKSWNSSINS